MTTREDFEAWAASEGLYLNSKQDGYDTREANWAFAAYVAATKAEREACAQLAENSHPQDWAFIGSVIRSRTQEGEKA